MNTKNAEAEKPELKRETAESKSNERTKQNSQTDLKVVLKPIAWIGVSTWCGKVFYLDANDYTSMDELNDAATYFTDQQVQVHLLANIPKNYVLILNRQQYAAYLHISKNEI